MERPALTSTTSHTGKRLIQASTFSNNELKIRSRSHSAGCLTPTRSQHSNRSNQMSPTSGVGHASMNIGLRIRELNEIR